MPKIRYPFLYFRPSFKLRPYIQIRITNPANGQSMETLGLVDTGSDSCALPGWIAAAIGHKLGAGINSIKVGTGAGTCSSECHTCAIEILDFRGQHFLTVKAAPVQVLPKLDQTLIRARGCLEFLKLTVDYPRREFFLTR